MSKIKMFGTVKNMAVCAMLCAVSVLIGKIPAIEVSNVLRFTLENFPIILAGFAYGGILGGAVGGISDLLGCLLKGYEVNPIITIGAILVGVTSGAVRRLFRRADTKALAAAVYFSHIAGNIIVKSIGLYLWYEAFRPTLIFRLPTYLITATIEFVLLALILKNKQARKMFISEESK